LKAVVLKGQQTSLCFHTPFQGLLITITVLMLILVPMDADIFRWDFDNISKLKTLVEKSLTEEMSREKILQTQTKASVTN